MKKLFVIWFVLAVTGILAAYFNRGATYEAKGDTARANTDSAKAKNWDTSKMNRKHSTCAPPL